MKFKSHKTFKTMSNRKIKLKARKKDRRWKKIQDWIHNLIS